MTTDTIEPGQIVTYHGSIALCHGHTYYVSMIDDLGRLTLVDADYPTERLLTQVRPSNVRPSGDRVALCECRHAAADTMRGEEDACGICGWMCRDHRAALTATAR